MANIVGFFWAESEAGTPVEVFLRLPTVRQGVANIVTFRYGYASVDFALFRADFEG